MNITGTFMALGIPVMNVNYVQLNSVLDDRSERVAALRNDVLMRSPHMLNTRFSQGVTLVFPWCPVFLKGRMKLE
jgi:hypothetical protein